MLNILKKNKPLEIYWWTDVEGLAEVCPILRGHEVPPPDYWNKIPKIPDLNVVRDRGTAKNCPAIPDMWNLGYVLPLWCDTKFTFSEGGRYTIVPSDNRFTFTHHGDSQYKDHLPKRVQDAVKMVIKANCPWRVRTPEGYSMMQLPMYYHHDELFEVLPGTIWTDIHHEINQQMVIKKHGEFILKRGHPLAAYIPFRRDNFKTIIEGPNPRNRAWDLESRTRLWTKFRFGYRMSQAEHKKKCPFHSLFQ